MLGQHPENTMRTRDPNPTLRPSHAIRGPRRYRRGHGLLLLALAGLLWWTGACSESDGTSQQDGQPADAADTHNGDTHNGDTHDGDAHNGGTDHPPQDGFVAHAAVLNLSLRLTPIGGPPMAGSMEAMLSVTRDGEAVAGVAIGVQPWMPGHGHGTPEVPTVEDNGDGTYRVANILYTMPGTWELRLSLELDGVSDAVVFTLEVGGEMSGTHPEGEPIAGTSEALGVEVTLRHMAASTTTGTHAARLRVMREGVGVEGLSVGVEPWMPGHGHGTPAVPRVEELGQGRYHVENIRYTMPGSWVLRITLAEGETADTVTLPVTVR